MFGILQVLLEHVAATEKGALLNTPDRSGNTPLHEAAMRGNHSAVKVWWTLVQDNFRVG